MSKDFSTPQSIPPEIKRYIKGSEKTDGKTGKVGILHLKFEKHSESGNTIIKEQYSRVPLLAQRAIYLEETLPTMAYVYILSPSAGILQGDRYRIDITLGNNTYAHVTTQGATRIYKMEKNYASQIINIKAEEESYFEYIPDQIIPFRNSRFYQEVHLNIHDNATMIYSEVIVPGRVASGEVFKYDICYLKIVARNHLGRLRFIDTVKLEPIKENFEAKNILGNLHVLGAIYVITKESFVNELCIEIGEMLGKLETRARILGGVSILPTKQGIIIRLLADSAELLKKTIFEIIGIARKNIIGASFSGIRKG